MIQDLVELINVKAMKICIIFDDENMIILILRKVKIRQHLNTKILHENQRNKMK